MGSGLKGKEPMMRRVHRAWSHRQAKTLLLALLVAGAVMLSVRTADALLIDFEGLAEGTVITDQYAFMGVTFAPLGLGGPVIATQGSPTSAFNSVLGEDSPMYSGVNGLTSVYADFSDNADITVDFRIPVTGVRLYIIDMDEGPYSLLAFDSSNNQVAIQTIDSNLAGISGDGVATLFSIFASDISRIVIDVPQGVGIGFAIDDLAFTPWQVPEPATLLLLASGFAGLVGMAAWRRQRR